jgi:hypothetical protein
MALFEGARERPGLFGPAPAPAPRRDHVSERRASAASRRGDPKAADRGRGRKKRLDGRSTARGQLTLSLGWNQAVPASAAPLHGATARDRQPAMESVPRRRARATLRAGRRRGRLGLLLGGIAIAFMLAFFSLAQTVRVTATDYEVDRLRAEQARLEGQRQELLSDLNRLGREPAIRKQAIDFGLFPLAEPVVIRAR